MQDYGWCDVSVGNFVVLDYGTEGLEVKGGHNYCSETSVGGEVDEALES